MESGTNAWERNSKLYYTLIGLVMSGARSIGWLNERLQAIVDEPNPIYQIPGLPRDFIRKLVEHWDRLLPSKGHSAVELVGPFFSPELSFKLRPAAENLIERVHEAIFWLDWGCPVVHTTPSALASRGPNLERSRFQYGFQEVAGWLLPEDLLQIFWPLPVEVRGFGYRSLDEKLRNCLWDSLWDYYEEAFEDERVEETPLHVLGDNLRVSLLYALGYLEAGDNRRDFRPLLELWRSGNLPLGLDHEGNFWVLCAEPEESEE